MTVSMTQDWAADVKKYVPDPHPKAISGIVRHLGVALRNRDSSLVSFNDKAETDRVRDKFLKKKLHVTGTDGELDEAIAEVATKMKGDTTRNRVTVYYLLAERFGKLSVFEQGTAH